MLNISKNVSSHLLASCRVSLRSSSLIWWKQPKMQSQTIMRSFLTPRIGRLTEERNNLTSCNIYAILVVVMVWFRKHEKVSSHMKKMQVRWFLLIWQMPALLLGYESMFACACTSEFMSCLTCYHGHTSHS
jgi:hypothetical protein